MNKNYKTEFSKDAKKQLEKLKKSGKQIYLQKIFSFLQEVEIDPRLGTGTPEQLKHQKAGKETWSRKINKKDRFVYEIFEEEKTILVIQVLGHYQDK